MASRRLIGLFALAMLAPQCGLFRRQGPPPGEVLEANDGRDLERALTLARQNKNELAAAYLTALLERVPNSFRVHRARQDVWLASGEEGKARVTATYGSLSEDTAFNLALKARIQDDPDRSRQLLERALADEPDFIWALLGMAFWQRRADSFERARDDLVKALDTWKDFPEALSDLAEVEEALGNYEAARDRYREYLNLRPLDLDARYGLAVLLSTAFTDARAADEQFTQILAISPEDLDALSGHATMLAYQQNYDEAIALYQEVLRRDSRRADIYYNLGWIHETQGDDLKAREFYQAFLDFTPTGPDPRSVFDVLFFVPNRIEAINERLQHAGG